jgi:hypothetical protein
MPDIDKKTISATQVPALFDASPYLTKFMLYRWFKYGDEVHGKEHNRMDWGTRMEPLCLAQAAEDLFFEVIPTRLPDGTQPYVRNGLLGCTRDAAIICPDRGPGALETKVCFDSMSWMRDWNGGKSVPRHIEIQLQMQMKVGDGVTSYKWGVISVWYGGEQKYFERKPMLDLWAAADAEAAQFFADLEAGKEPDPFGASIEAPLIAHVFPPDDAKVLDLSKLERGKAEHATALAIAEDVRMMAYHSGERLGHARAEKELKAKLLAIAKDNGTVLLPYGINYKVKQSPRAGFIAKPTVATSVDPYVPQDVPEGDLTQFYNADLGG